LTEEEAVVTNNVQYK